MSLSVDMILGVEIPECPLGHRGSVVRAGWYGRAGQRRQRWLCRPVEGEPHRFAEVLPRIVASAAEHVCADCATQLEPWEGQPAPRLYGFAARDIAHALALVAGGATYRATAAAVRTAAGRELDTVPRRNAKGRRQPQANAHGGLVSDWVEVCAPLIWAAYAPAEWPRRLVLDSAEFRHGSPGKARGEAAFSALAAMGYDPSGRSFVAAPAGSSSTAAPSWPASPTCGPRHPSAPVHPTPTSPMPTRPSSPRSRCGAANGTWPATSPTPCPTGSAATTPTRSTP